LKLDLDRHEPTNAESVDYKNDLVNVMGYYL